MEKCQCIRTIFFEFLLDLIVLVQVSQGGLTVPSQSFYFSNSSRFQVRIKPSNKLIKVS